MPETTQPTPSRHSRSRSARTGTDRHNQPGYLVPVLYFSGAILLLILAKLFHTGILSPATGAAGIIILAVSKIWKFKPGIVISSISIFTMVLFSIWHLSVLFLTGELTAEMPGNPSWLLPGLAEGVILAIMAWFYYRLLNSIYLHMGKKWFVKKSWVISIRLLFYFQIFLILFPAITFLIQKIVPTSLLSPTDGALFGGALALLASGIPALIYLVKVSPDGKKRHTHLHHHRHHRSEAQKNIGPGEN